MTAADAKRSTRRRIEDGRVLYFMWCPADFNAKTSHLTDEARAAYRELLDFAFLHGRNQTDLPDDDRYLMMAAKAKPRHWPTIKFLLFECPKPMFVPTNDGYWRNPRLAEEVEIALEKSGQASAAANLRHDRERNTDAVRTGYVRSAPALRPQSASNANKKESKKKKKKQPTETSSPPVQERESTAARDGRMSVAAFTARCREVSAFLARHPGALQCFWCSPHAPHGRGDCQVRTYDTTRCDCNEVTEETRLENSAAKEFERQFGMMTWDVWCGIVASQREEPAA